MSSTTVTATRCWEYRAVYLDRLSGVEADLDQLGDEGWELVSVAADYAYFKRSTDADRTLDGPSPRRRLQREQLSAASRLTEALE